MMQENENVDKKMTIKQEEYLESNGVMEAVDYALTKFLEKYKEYLDEQETMTDEDSSSSDEEYSSSEDEANLDETKVGGQKKRHHKTKRDLHSDMYVPTVQHDPLGLFGKLLLEYKSSTAVDADVGGEAETKE